MNPQTLGPFMALGTAVTWAGSVMFYKKSGEGMSPFGLNYFKNAVALALFAVSLPAMGIPFVLDASFADVAILLGSGALGIGVADTLFFRGLNQLGASRSAIFECLYAPSCVLFAVLLLGEKLTALHLVGALSIVAAVLLVTLRGGDRPEEPKGPLVRGALASSGSMVSMAFAIVVAKPVLERYPVLWTTSVRLFGGVALLTVLALSRAQTRRAVREVFMPQRSWRYALPGAVLGTYVSLILWIGGFKYTSASTASLLNQTSALFVVLFATLFLKEPFTRAHALALVLACGGSALVLW